MRPHLGKWLDAELSRRTYDTSIEVIGELKAQANPEVQGLYAFYLAEAYRQRGKNDDMATAEKYYAESISHASPPPDAWREQGHILRTKGDKQASAQAFKRYLTEAPDAPDRAFIETYITQMESSL